ncbi:hypothetical protein [Empedobacter sp. GD03797]|uniref:hypothetical protein n=1 Tax=Empedobacter sp. GD03797 TaxID=2975382 RepID=UPI00244CBF42|nr:hypothetical protein [Empedobacter sp. GD03797]MDH1883911.1 hypothetical protein [Empedobacter sp. GD03797]
MTEDNVNNAVNNVLELSHIDEFIYSNAIYMAIKIKRGIDENILYDYLVYYEDFYSETISFGTFELLLENIIEIINTICLIDDVFDEIISVNTNQFFYLVNQLYAIGFKGIRPSNNSNFDSFEVTRYNSDMVQIISAYLTVGDCNNDINIFNNCRNYLLNLEGGYDRVYNCLLQLSDDGLRMIECFNKSFLSIEINTREFLRFIEILLSYREVAFN